MSVRKQWSFFTKLISLLLLGSTAAPLQAANWLMLQGTEPDSVAPKGVVMPNRNKVPRVWGFIQANYRQDSGDVFVGADGKNKTPFSLLNPTLTDQSGLNIFRARIAVRGMADNDNLVNYFVMTEFGNNGINDLGGHRTSATYFTDASVTLKHVPGAKLRVGMFKTPGSEEGLRAVFVSPYIDFTTMTNQQLLERQVSDVGAAQTGGVAGGAATVHYTSTRIDQPISAFRDVGAQIFDTFQLGDGWTASYAYMYGNGSGISHSGSNDQGTHYGYLAVEENFGAGKGYYTEALKFFLWGQSGKRVLYSTTTDGNGTTSTSRIDADRQRYGVGVSYYRNGLRAEAEYIRAEGMIFTGAKDTDTDPLKEEWQFQFATDTANKADGGYINLQYELLPKKFEVFGRYDFMNRLTNDEKGERDFRTLTLGCSYRFRGPTRIDFNYLIRNAEAPGNDAAQTVLDNIGNRLSVQVTAAF